jgi:predicted HTH domain antitoxin
MTVSFQLPSDLERVLRNEVKDIDQAAKEALLVDLYRGRKISHVELAQALGLDRFETEAVLKRHNVTEDLPTVQEMEEDGRALERVLGPAR